MKKRKFPCKHDFETLSIRLVEGKLLRKLRCIHCKKILVRDVTRRPLE